MTFSGLHHPHNPSAHRARFLHPGPVGGQGIMVFLTVPSRGALWRAPRAGAQVRYVAKTPPSLAHPRSTPETPREERFEFWARMFCGFFFQPHTKIAAWAARPPLVCVETTKILQVGGRETSATPLPALGSRLTTPARPRALSGHVGTFKGPVESFTAQK